METPPPAPVRDHRVRPAGVLPQHLQAWLLTGVAMAMMVIIAWSMRSAPGRVRVPALAPPAEPDQARIEEYQRQLEEEATRLKREQEELDRLRQPPSAARSSSSHVSGDPDRGRERTLHADNVAFTRRREDVSLTGAAAQQQPSNACAASVAAPAIPAATHAAADVLREGTLMEAVLLNRLDGTFAGPVICAVSVPVHARGTQQVLVPQGARVRGESKPVSTFGQSRLAIVFHRLELPDGRRVSLDAAQGLTALGEAGLTDEVDYHYARMFGASMALGLLSGFAQYGPRGGVGFDQSFGDSYRQAAGASVAQSGMHALDRFTNILPSVTIREGHRLRIYLTHDVAL